MARISNAPDSSGMFYIVASYLYMFTSMRQGFGGQHVYWQVSAITAIVSQI